MPASPTERTLRRLLAIGYLAEKVEQWNPWSRTRHDLFNAFDILAVRADKGTLGIQATTASHGAARWAKMTANPSLRTWLAAGNRAELWTWKRVGSSWLLNRREIRLRDIAA